MQNSGHEADFDKFLFEEITFHHALTSNVGLFVGAEMGR